MQKYTKSASLMVGVGLASGSKRCLTRSVPLDSLAFLVAAKAIGNAAHFDVFAIFVADNPAAYPFVNATEVAVAANALISTVTRFAQAAKWDHYEIVRASTIAQTEDWVRWHALFCARVATDEELATRDETARNYVAIQLADMAFMAAEHGVAVKVGWSEHAVEGERLFDRLYVRLLTESGGEAGVN